MYYNICKLSYYYYEHTDQQTEIQTNRHRQNLQISRICGASLILIADDQDSR